MNGKIRDGSMLRMAPLPNTNRKMTARLPVQNAIGNPSIKSSASDPNSRIVSQPMPISRPTLGRLAGDDHDVLDQLREALERHQRRADRHHQLDRPVLDAPFGE